MKIVTKFNINDTVYILHNNKIYETMVIGIGISVLPPNIKNVTTNDNSIKIYYTVDGESLVSIINRIPESNLFISRQELINSL